MSIAVINPATGETEETFEPFSPAAVEDRLARAARAAADYRHTRLDERAGWLRAAGDLLDRDRDDVATMMTTEMGKTLTAARAEVEKRARGRAASTPSTPPRSWPTSRRTPRPSARHAPTPPTSRSARCSR